jgi:TolB-like protein
MLTPTGLSSLGDSERPLEMTPSGDVNQGMPRRKTRKLRSAWISFASRIIAQMIGAVGTVLLSLILVQHYLVPDAGDGPGLDPRASSATAGLAQSSGKAALAVLPLVNYSADPQQDYFADGMTEALVSELSHIQNLRVVSRTSSMHYKDQRRRLPEIGRELNVDLIIEGSVRPAGDRVRVTAQLIDARTDEHVWSGSYDGSVENVIRLQDEVARAIAQDVEARVIVRDTNGPALK